MTKARYLCATVALVTGLLASASGQAAAVTANIGTLTRMWVHGTFGNGDVWFAGTTVVAPARLSGCAHPIWA